MSFKPNTKPETPTVAEMIEQLKCLPPDEHLFFVDEDGFEHMLSGVFHLPGWNAVYLGPNQDALINSLRELCGNSAEEDDDMDEQDMVEAGAEEGGDVAVREPNLCLLPEPVRKDNRTLAVEEG